MRNTIRGLLNSIRNGDEYVIDRYENSISANYTAAIRCSEFFRLPMNNQRRITQMYLQDANSIAELNRIIEELTRRSSNLITMISVKRSELEREEDNLPEKDVRSSSEDKKGNTLATIAAAVTVGAIVVLFFLFGFRRGRR